MEVAAHRGRVNPTVAGLVTARFAATHSVLLWSVALGGGIACTSRRRLARAIGTHCSFTQRRHIKSPRSHSSAA